MTEKPTAEADEMADTPAKVGKPMGFFDHLEELRWTLIKCAIVVISIVAAVVTPTTDPFNPTLFALPLYVLYEAAILVASLLTRRRTDEIIEA